MDDHSITTAVTTAGLAILAKVVYDFWSRWREQRGTAAAIAGEVAAYISMMKPETASGFRQIIKIERTLRARRLRAIPAPPNTHPVFDKVADKIGYLAPEDAVAISRFYNVVTGFRIHIANLSSDKFLDADDDFQAGILNFLANAIDEEVAKAKQLIERLQRTANRGFLAFLLNNDAGPDV